MQIPKWVYFLLGVYTLYAFTLRSYWVYTPFMVFLLGVYTPYAFTLRSYWVYTPFKLFWGLYHMGESTLAVSSEVTLLAQAVGTSHVHGTAQYEPRKRNVGPTRVQRSSGRSCGPPDGRSRGHSLH